MQPHIGLDCTTDKGSLSSMLGFSIGIFFPHSNRIDLRQPISIGG